MKQKENIERVYIGNKDISKYLSACFFALSDDRDEVLITGRGNNVKRTIDVAAILLRQYLEIPDNIPTLKELLDILDKEDIETAKDMIKKMMTCEIKIGSEKFEERNVSTLDITLRGKKKDA